MTSYTQNLKLLKKDPSTDGNDTFNIETMLNENWDKVDKEVWKKADKKTHIVYFSESQNWTVPKNVTQIDVFIVDGGYDGANGSVAPASSGSSATTGYGGDGGNGGACVFYPNLNVVPGMVIPVVVGAINGGKSAFDGLSSVNIECSIGGDSYVIRTPSPSMPITDAKGNLPVINGIFTGVGCKCPIDGKYYGISGAAGCNDTNRTKTEISAGGVAGKNNADKRPMYGEVIENSMSYYYVASGGGASYDNDGYPNESQTVGGKGGDAVSYGCGGGGGGGAPYGGTGGAGGAGATGGVIVAY